MFYVVLELLKPAQLSFGLTADKKLTVFELISQVFSVILSASGQVKNFNVKGILMSQCFKPLVAKATQSDRLAPQKKTSAYLRILKAASLGEWMNPEERTKKLTQVLLYLNQLIDDKCLDIGDQVLEEFDAFMKEGFELHHKEKKEP